MSLLLQAYAISAIAHWDWPENWPDLFDQLIPALGSGEPNLVHGTMRVLSGMCVEGRREWGKGWSRNPDPFPQEREGSGELCIQAMSYQNAISWMM